MTYGRLAELPVTELAHHFAQLLFGVTLVCPLLHRLVVTSASGQLVLPGTLPLLSCSMRFGSGAG